MKEYSDKLLRTPRILVTGKPGIGKTSLIKDISKEINKIRIGGFYTEEIRRNGTRVGFKFVSFSGESRLLASIEPIGKLKVGKYYLVESLDILGEVKEDIMKADMIIMDEIGPMELKIGELREIIYEGLALRNLSWRQFIDPLG